MNTPRGRMRPSATDDEVALADIEDPLAEAIDAAGIGEYDGNESGARKERINLPR